MIEFLNRVHGNVGIDHVEVLLGSLKVPDPLEN